jgi:hypothetical protein
MRCENINKKLIEEIMYKKRLKDKKTVEKFTVSGNVCVLFP